MELFNTERARFAANGLLAVEITLGTLAFWSHAFEQGGWPRFVVAALLTATFGFISLLASGVVIRAVSARQAAEPQPVTLPLVVFCGGVLVTVGAALNWHGLTWADAQAELIPGADWDWLLIPAAGLLSSLNLVAVYVFCRDLKPVSRQPQLIHFPVEGEKDPAAQAMARKSWEKRRANG